MALAERASVCVANDSGTGHLFAATGRPLISLFGPTPPAKFRPETDPLIVLRAQDFGSGEMAAIPVEAVAHALERLRSSP